LCCNCELLKPDVSKEHCAFNFCFHEFLQDFCWAWLWKYKAGITKGIWYTRSVRNGNDIDDVSDERVI